MSSTQWCRTGACFAVAAMTLAESATADMPMLEPISVEGARINLIGQAVSASEGRVSQQELDARPMLRTGEILEMVPGMVATQHSGSGKANQFFLRGINLDHGSDFNTSIDGMPVNMPSHGHGQGYTDLNFVIPELIDEITYRKGSYYANVADFSGAGAAQIRTQTHNIPNRVTVGIGEDHYTRTLLTGSFGDAEDTPDNIASRFIYGAEYQTYDGPWTDIEEHVKKKNLWLKQVWQNGADWFGVSLMAYDNSWNSADQIPDRAVQQGIISKLGSIDTTVGGESSRYSLALNGAKGLGDGELSGSVYAIQYEMNLWSDFSYFTSPDGNGDQFKQVDDRGIYGWDLAWRQPGNLGDRLMTNTLGTQFRYDDIDQVGLFRTQARTPLPDGDIRLDRVEQWSMGVYWQNEIDWTDRFRTVFGVRYDYYDFDTEALAAIDPSTLADNTGSADDDIISPSLNLIYSLSETYESYFSIGKGFHSNDARGVTTTRDPSSGDAVASADPLVDTLGYEVGLRAYFSEQLHASVALWRLENDSELIFVGDEGTTEDTGLSSTRDGLELTLHYWMNQMWSFDLEYAYTDARYDDVESGSDAIPGALEQVITGGINGQFGDALSAHLRLRYFDDYPLDEGRRAPSSFIANLGMRYAWTGKLSTDLDILNLTDSDDHDVEYYYESQLASEPAPVFDHHYHVFEPRTVRVYLSYQLD